MNDDNKLEAFMSSYSALAKRSKREKRMIFNHLCIRVEDIDEAERLFRESFGLDGFLSPGGETFEGEKEIRVCWLPDNDVYLEISEFEQGQQIGYDTGVGQPIGHLSEIGFFVPDMDRALEDLTEKGWRVTSQITVEGARMYKVENKRTPGIPVELIDLEVAGNGE